MTFRVDFALFDTAFPDIFYSVSEDITSNPTWGGIIQSGWQSCHHFSGPSHTLLALKSAIDTANNARALLAFSLASSSTGPIIVGAIKKAIFRHFWKVLQTGPIHVLDDDSVSCSYFLCSTLPPQQQFLARENGNGFIRGFELVELWARECDVNFEFLGENIVKIMMFLWGALSWAHIWELPSRSGITGGRLPVSGSVSSAVDYVR